MRKIKSVVPGAKRRNSGQKDREHVRGMKKGRKSSDSGHQSVKGLKMGIGTYPEWYRMVMDVSRFDCAGKICNKLSTW